MEDHGLASFEDCLLALKEFGGNEEQARLKFLSPSLEN
jgi:hypothetical protein